MARRLGHTCNSFSSSNSCFLFVFCSIGSVSVAPAIHSYTLITFSFARQAFFLQCFLLKKFHLWPWEFIIFEMIVHVYNPERILNNNSSCKSVKQPSNVSNSNKTTLNSVKSQEQNVIRPPPSPKLLRQSVFKGFNSKVSESRG
jgi:hypothetical protein